MHQPLVRQRRCLISERLASETTPFFSLLPRTQHNAHNQYLHWAAAEGIPVALAFILLLAWTIYWLLRRSACWPSPSARALGLAAALGLITFLLCNCVDAISGALKVADFIGACWRRCWR